ncbi:hypothetical protein GF391_04425 [Candidatus Uhrbacteria bacterium]|nr:hypothetical protein [Candidatus Uhrbacteria bacterium]
MRKFPLIALIAIVSLSAGCFEPISTINVAAPLDSFGNNNIPQLQGFGNLPPTPQVPQTNAMIRINTNLPTLQPDVTVLRLPPNGLNETQFQNLTSSLDMPIGLVGQEAKNLEIAFTWTNANNEVLSYDSTNRRLTFADASNSPGQLLVSSWPDTSAIELAVTDFLRAKGMDPTAYNNPEIQKNWREWQRQIQTQEACVNQNTLSALRRIKTAKDMLSAPPPASVSAACLQAQYPSRIPVTFDLVIDKRNIIGKDGKTEVGGFLVLNARNLAVEYGWLTLSAEPARSDYPAITEQQMRANMLNGGLGGEPEGMVDINETFFSFMRLDTGDEYSFKYLIPALVGSGIQTISGTEIPYNIVVPLTE